MILRTKAVFQINRYLVGFKVEGNSDSSVVHYPGINSLFLFFPLVSSILVAHLLIGVQAVEGTLEQWAIAQMA